MRRSEISYMARKIILELGKCYNSEVWDALDGLQGIQGVGSYEGYGFYISASYDSGYTRPSNEYTRKVIGNGREKDFELLIWFEKELVFDTKGTHKTGGWEDVLAALYDNIPAVAREQEAQKKREKEALELVRCLNVEEANRFLVSRGLFVQKIKGTEGDIDLGNHRYYTDYKIYVLNEVEQDPERAIKFSTKSELVFEMRYYTDGSYSERPEYRIEVFESGRWFNAFRACCAFLDKINCERRKAEQMQRETEKARKTQEYLNQLRNL